jgi:hypothetical protein
VVVLRGERALPRIDPTRGLRGLGVHLLRRSHRDARACAPHPLGSGKRLEQPREEERQHRQQLDATNGSDHPSQYS